LFGRFGTLKSKEIRKKRSNSKIKRAGELGKRELEFKAWGIGKRAG